MADPQLLGRPRRRLVVTVRGAADVPAANSKPYVLLQLGEDKVQTSPAEVGGANPVGARSAAAAAAAACCLLPAAARLVRPLP